MQMRLSQLAKSDQPEWSALVNCMLPWRRSSRCAQAAIGTPPLTRATAPFFAVTLLASLVCLAEQPAAEPPVEEPAAHGAERTDQNVAAAYKLLLEGKYEEATEAYAALADAHPLEAAWGQARVRFETGHSQEAIHLLQTTLEAWPEEPPAAAAPAGDLPAVTAFARKRASLAAELARAAFETGKLPECRTWLDKSLAWHKDCTQAHWQLAEWHRVQGQLAEAEKEYSWLVDYYNTTADLSDPEELLWIAKGASQFARWKRLPDQFKFLVNELLPDIQRAHKQFWRARLEAGTLFLEKYNTADALREIQGVLTINPNSAEGIAALAELKLQSFQLDEAQKLLDRALAINPELLIAKQLRADVYLSDFQEPRALELMEEALGQNPLSEATLARKAAALVAMDGFQPDRPGTRLSQVAELVIAANPHCGEFFCVLGNRLEERRRFDGAEWAFNECSKRMPQFVGANAGLGMMFMRLGREAEAQKLLEQAYAEDPFNMRVVNTLRVLEVLDGYATLETDHFIIKYDAEKDALLAQYVADYLEHDVYPALCQQFGFEPDGKSLFEIFNKAKNTNGHGWFSARMVGMPFLGTVGACAGRIVALASPNDMPEKYNWSRVVKHEFVHVLNLQQTNFNTPHWFTEGLATLNEHYPRAEDWNQLLLRRMAEDTLFDLNEINFGFIRPQSSDDWTLAYCQAELYCEYMLHAFGEDALAKMLAAFANNLTTEAAIQQSFGQSLAEFEAGYSAYLKETAASLKLAAEEASDSLPELERLHQASPDDPAIMARLAKAQLAKKDYPAARKWANLAIAADAKQPAAHYVLARLHVLTGEVDQAVSLLESQLDRAKPDMGMLALLAGIKLQQKDYPAAEELYRLAADIQPGNTAWKKGLARIYLLTKRDSDLAPVLAELAMLDADDLAMRKKLAQLALDRSDWAEAQKWAMSALRIDVFDVASHRQLAEACLADSKNEQAAYEYETAAKLDPKDPALCFGLAKARLALGQTPEALAAAHLVKGLAPDYPGLAELLKELTP